MMPIPIAFFAALFSVTASLSLSIVSAQETTKNWYKGNLHTHSLWSDGNDFPDMIVHWYVENGYHFLALTDHNVLSEGTRWMSTTEIRKRGGNNAIRKYFDTMGHAAVETRKNANGNEEVRLRTYSECKQQFDSPGKFLLLQGEEISDAVDKIPLHMNATNLNELLMPTGGASIREAMRANLRAAKLQATRSQREILVHLNHPNFGWAVSAQDLAAVTEERFFEVYNAHPDVNHLGDENRPSTERIWDIANTIRTGVLDAPPIFGLATDDSHHYHGQKSAKPGRGWIMVHSTELTADSILKSINAGEFYASSGVAIDRISFNPKNGIFRIEIAPQEGAEYETTFIGTPKSSIQQIKSTGNGNRFGTIHSNSIDVGKVFASVKGDVVEYQMTGDELYVRATITSSKLHTNPSFDGQYEQAWAQPIVWKK